MVSDHSCRLTRDEERVFSLSLPGPFIPFAVQLLFGCLLRIFVFRIICTDSGAGFVTHAWAHKIYVPCPILSEVQSQSGPTSGLKHSV